MSSIFRFKQFSVRNEISSMKVNTDGVLLGAAVSLDGHESSVLDIGTGTGTIALILAQRLPGAIITGIDIDGPSIEEASFNFSESPWPERLSAEHCALEDYSPLSPFDLMVSNPPYYDNSLLNPSVRESLARHSVTMSYREVLLFASGFLSEKGRLAMILPSSTETALLREARSRGLFPSRVLRIKTVPRKSPSRIMVEFSRFRLAVEEEILSIQDGNGNFTDRYKEFTGDFYL